MSGKVSQLGTLSFQPSMTAATIMAKQTKAKGQCSRMNRMGGLLSFRGRREGRTRQPFRVQGSGVGSQGSAKAEDSSRCFPLTPDSQPLTPGPEGLLVSRPNPVRPSSRQTAQLPVLPTVVPT